MLIIKPIQDKNEQEQLCLSCGVEYDIEALAYGAWIAESPDAPEREFIAICQFKLGASARITDLACAAGKNDLEALFIMGRQTMNFIDLHGIHHAYFEGANDEKFIKWLGFTKDENGKWAADLEAFFKHPCSSEKK